MSRFVLTAQIQLQAPTNARRVLGQIRDQLGSARPVSIPVEIVGAQRAQKEIRNITRETELASTAAEALGRNFGLAIKRFAAFTVASRAVSLFTNSLANAVDDAITFQREVIKISQVTGDSVSELRGLQKTISDLSTSLGTSSKDLLAVTRIFSQAGVRGRDLEVALSGIAKTTLAPTFENITDTAEGAVAILSQFQRGVRSLEGQLGSINAVAGQFAVESDDLIGAVRRFGGVFKASGGSLEELLAVFTSVRATTRESAESISTGLRTIFTRIQRPTTIKYLEDLGIKLTDVNGKFVGPFEAAQRLGKALEGLTEGDTKFIAIAEELGGFRQIGKVIPLLRQYKVSQDALITAQQGSTSLTKDAETAQQALAVQITKVREEFFALVRSIAESSSFQIFARTSLQLASGLIKVADALKPLLPLLATLAAFKFAQGVGGFLGGIGNTIRNIDTIAANSATRGPTRRNSGGKILGFNSGGLVPGSGNRDTVPAMLTPGEFVIKKSSVKKLGPEKLAAMNENRYATGSTGRGIEALDLDDSSFLGQVAERGKLKGKTLEEAYSLVGKNLPGTFTRVSKSIFSSAFGEGALEKAAKIISSGYNPKLETTKPATTRIGRISQQLESASSPKELTKRTEDKGKSFITNEGPLDIEPDRSVYGAVFLNQPTTGKKSFVGTVAASGIEKSFRATRQFKLYEAAARERLGKKDAKIPIPENIKKRIKNNKFIVKTGYLDKQVSENVKESILDGIINTVSNSSRVFDKEMSAKGSFNRDEAGVAKFLKSINVDNIVGNIFEGVLTSAGIPYASTKDESNAPIDFPKGVGGALAAKFNNTALANIPTDAKTRDTSDNIASFLKKIKNFEAARLANSPLASSVFNGLKLTKNPGGKNASLGGESSNKKIKPIKRASGGGVSGVSKSDTVPALLTPGEFVINKKSAERIGYGNLNRMNKQGIVGFNKGGPVDGPQRFSNGGTAESRASGTRGIDTPGAREKGLQRAYKATTDSIKSLEAESESLYKSLDLATSRLKKLDDQIDELNKTKGGNKASKRAAEARIGLENERQRIEQEINKTEQKLTKKRSDQTDLKENLDRVRIERIKRATRENIQDPDTPTATRRRRRSRNASSANARSDSESAGQQSVGGNDPFGSLFVQLGVLSGVAAGVNTAISTLGNKSLEASDGMAALTIIGEKTASTLTVLGTTLITSLAGFKSLSKVLKETSGKSGFVNRSKNIGARAGQVGLGAFTAVAVVSAIGEAVSSGLSEFADRQAKIAQSKGDVAGAISASRASQQASSFGELFTIGGLAQSFFDPNFFKNQRKKVDIAGAEAGISAFGSASSIVEDNIRSGGNISQATSKLSQAAFAASDALNKLEPGSLKAIELRKQLNDQLKSGITNLVNNGASIDEATNAARQFAAGNERVSKELLAFAQSAIAAREAQKLLTRANIDSLKISSAFAAATSSVQAFVDGIKNPGETLSNNLQQLESNFSSVGVDAKPLIDSIQKQLESIVPADSPLKDAIKNQSNFARSISDFSLNVGNVLGNAEISSSNVAAAREDIQSLLRSAIPQDLPGPDRRKIQTIISDRVAKATESVSSVAEIDLSTITKDIANQARELSKGFFESAKLLANHNKLMLGLYQERQRLEQSAALAANEAIDIQLQAAKDFESFGGGKLTEGQRASANIAKFNNLSSSIGVNLAGRSADDFRNASSQISNIFAQSQQVRASRIAGFQGAVSPEQAASLDQSDKAIQSSKELIKTAQEEIAIRKAEIEIIRQKNKEEKDSLDRLISGDIEGFIQGQASSGAAAALRTGSSDLTSLFSASALGRGFKSLEDQGLSSEQLNRASSLTLNRFGINDDRSAGILSGNSEEIQRLNREGRDLSATIAEIAGETARFASSEIQIQDAVINAASVRFNETLNQVSAVNQGTQALSRGGTVYASRGMFVPRGTDTVPAMLTPGEFVVNRSAVRRGNNLQILRAMNSGGGASSQTHMKGGGQVSYYNMGGVVEGISSAFSNALPQLSNIFNDFSASVDKLVNSKFTVKLDPTNINVNFNGASFLQSMKEDIKNELLDHVASEISSYKLNSSGDLEKRPTIN